MAKLNAMEMGRAVQIGTLSAVRNAWLAAVLMLPFWWAVLMPGLKPRPFAIAASLAAVLTVFMWTLILRRRFGVRTPLVTGGVNMLVTYALLALVMAFMAIVFGLLMILLNMLIMAGSGVDLEAAANDPAVYAAFWSTLAGRFATFVSVLVATGWLLGALRLSPHAAATAARGRVIVMETLSWTQGATKGLLLAFVVGVLPWIALFGVGAGIAHIMRFDTDGYVYYGMSSAIPALVLVPVLASLAVFSAEAFARLAPTDDPAAATPLPDRVA